MVRVAGLKRRIATGIAVRGRQRPDAARGARGDLRPHPRADGPARRLLPRGRPARRWPRRASSSCAGTSSTDDEQDRAAARSSSDRIFPVLTPLAVDPAHPFPYISGLSLNLAVVVRNPDTGTEHFARVKVPPLLPRFVRWPQPARSSRSRTSSPRTSTSCSPAWRCCSTTRSGSRATRTSRSRRTTRRTCCRRWSASCMRRRFGPPVRLEVERDHRPARARPARPRAGHRRAARSCPLPGPLDLTGLMAVADVDRARPEVPAVRAAHAPATSPRSRRRRAATSSPRCATATCSLHHPYDSFSTSVQRFLEQAAADPHVLAIKQTLYRTSGDSPIVDALIDAAEAGKQVLVLVEIKARFDEQANISWARKLEQAGCHVVYGLVGLKTHCKLSLVVRAGGRPAAPLLPHRHRQLPPQDRPALRGPRPAHRRPAGRRGRHQPVQLLSGYSSSTEYDRAARGPALAARRPGRADRAGDRAPPGRARRRGDPDQGQLASSTRRSSTRSTGPSQAGVPVDIWVRGICALRPGVPGPVREHPGPQRPRPVPGALPGVRASATAASREMLDRLGRPDAPQPRPPGRGAGPARAPRARRRSSSGCSTSASTEDTASWHLGPDGEWTRHAYDADGRPLRTSRRRSSTQAHARRTRWPSEQPVSEAHSETRPRGRAQVPGPRPVPAARLDGPPRSAVAEPPGDGRPDGHLPRHRGPAAGALAGHPAPPGGRRDEGWHLKLPRARPPSEPRSATSSGCRFGGAVGSPPRALVDARARGGHAALAVAPVAALRTERDAGRSAARGTTRSAELDRRRRVRARRVADRRGGRSGWSTASASSRWSWTDEGRRATRWSVVVDRLGGSGAVAGGRSAKAVRRARPGRLAAPDVPSPAPVTPADPARLRSPRTSPAHAAPACRRTPGAPRPARLRPPDAGGRPPAAQRAAGVRPAGRPDWADALRDELAWAAGVLGACAGRRGAARAAGATRRRAAARAAGPTGAPLLR